MITSARRVADRPSSAHGKQAGRAHPGDSGARLLSGAAAARWRWRLLACWPALDRSADHGVHARGAPRGTGARRARLRTSTNGFRWSRSRRRPRSPSSPPRTSSFRSTPASISNRSARRCAPMSAAAKLRGASTISQQVAKNLFLWSGHSFVRKGLEAMFTVLIETLWPKERILEMYLNIAEFGRGIYGVQAAARAASSTRMPRASTATRRRCWRWCCPIRCCCTSRRPRATCWHSATGRFSRWRTSADPPTAT